ncbi:MAG: hypothetical protein ABI197_09485 [Granulicella sp.]
MKNLSLGEIIISPYKPYELVSLLAILEHDAAEFWNLSLALAKIAGQHTTSRGEGTFGKLRAHLKALNLHVSARELQKSIQKLGKSEDSSYEEFEVEIASLCRVISSELENRKFVYIEADRQHYLARTGFDDLLVSMSFPSAEKDILAAGRCYAYGEPDACMFHAMRALEYILTSLQVKFDVSDKGQWQTTLEAIEGEIRKIGISKVQGVKKSDEDREAEAYFGKIASQLVHFKNGYRNYVMHGRENYSDRDAKMALDSVEYLFEIASIKLSEV